jgi:predicted 3-demethylubiquinone-9 3-methyltransferase (glyoxalase superfamily)
MQKITSISRYGEAGPGKKGSVMLVELKLTTSKDKAKAQRVFQAMLKMVKIDVKTLERAAAGA